MSNIGAHDNHKLLSYHDNEPLRYNYHTIDIIAHHYTSVKVSTETVHMLTHLLGGIYMHEEVLPTGTVCDNDTLNPV